MPKKIAGAFREDWLYFPFYPLKRIQNLESTLTAYLQLLIFKLVEMPHRNHKKMQI
jgi:hypothetical protein